MRVLFELLKCDFLTGSYVNSFANKIYACVREESGRRSERATRE